MNNLYIEDLSRGTFLEQEYDLAIFSCGYEERCIDVPSLINPEKIKCTSIIHFDQHHNDPQRKICEEFFNEKYKRANHLSINQTEIALLHSHVSQLVNVIQLEKHTPLRILIDYTSMSRAWYAALLTFFMKFYGKNVVVDLTYTNGVYHETDLNVELGDLKVIPGCEGNSLTKRNNAAIFMLGFDSYGPLRLYNLLNPNRCFGVLASPASIQKYEDTCIEKNKAFITHHLGGIENIIKLPINSLATCYEHMSQILMPLQQEYNVSIIPFGPKPHIITSILCSLNFNNVTCMYSEYKRNRTAIVQSTGDITASRVIFEPE